MTMPPVLKEMPNQYGPFTVEPVSINNLSKLKDHLEQWSATFEKEAVWKRTECIGRRALNGLAAILTQEQQPSALRERCKYLLEEISFLKSRNEQSLQSSGLCLACDQSGKPQGVMQYSTDTSGVQIFCFETSPETPLPSTAKVSGAGAALLRYAEEIAKNTEGKEVQIVNWDVPYYKALGYKGGFVHLLSSGVFARKSVADDRSDLQLIKLNRYFIF